MSDTMLAAEAPAEQEFPDFAEVSDVMLYDIARRTATLLAALALARRRAAKSDKERERWGLGNG